MKDNKQNWFCAQMGAREHYAIPRALHVKGRLGGLFTDYWSGGFTRSLAKNLTNKVTMSLAARSHADVPNDLIHSWNLRAMIWDAQIKARTSTGSTTGRYLGYCEVGKKFANAVVHSIQKRGSLPEGSVFFGYDTCSLEVMRYFKEHGGVCILDQIDPCRVEIEMVRAEQAAWPGWQSYDLDVPEEFYQRHQDEWALADRIVVNSDFSRGALVEQGVDTHKISVVPLTYEPPVFPDSDITPALERIEHGFSSQRPFRVLFLGQVMLRKGIQYLIKAAEQLTDSSVVFDIVGPIYISEKALAAAPSNVQFHGRISRSEIADWYNKTDLFVLPTLSDGFAITQIEAMAYGLPVIATVNCGEVVSDGVDGFIVPTRDPDSITRVICQYLEQPDVLKDHSKAALIKSRLFSLSRVGDSLLSLEQDIVSQLGLMD